MFTLQNERVLEIPSSLFSLSLQTIEQNLKISGEEFAKNYQSLIHLINVSKNESCFYGKNLEV